MVAVTSAPVTFKPKIVKTHGNERSAVETSFGTVETSKDSTPPPSAVSSGTRVMRLNEDSRTPWSMAETPSTSGASGAAAASIAEAPAPEQASDEPLVNELRLADAIHQNTDRVRGRSVNLVNFLMNASSTTCNNGMLACNGFGEGMLEHLTPTLPVLMMQKTCQKNPESNACRILKCHSSSDPSACRELPCVASDGKDANCVTTDYNSKYSADTACTEAFGMETCRLTQSAVCASLPEQHAETCKAYFTPT